MRREISIALNVTVPGSGLVLARRERWGTAFAFLFCAFGLLALFGGWITPASIPKSMTHLGLAGSAIIWLAAQWVLFSRLSALSNAKLSDEKATLIELASEAMEDGTYVNARLALESALELDDEDVQVNAHWARLMTLMGRFRDARRAWKRVQQLDAKGQFDREAAAALRELPSGR
jgi:hypothetical protein